MKQTPTQWITRYARTAPVTAGIVVACVALWLATAVQARSVTESYAASGLAHALTLWGPLTGHDVVGWLRPLGSAFMHLDAGHLTLNMCMLLLIGREIERYLGSALYVVTYLAGALAASAAVLTFDFDTPTVGASGALFALMVVLVGVYQRRGMGIAAPLVLVVVNMAYTFLNEGVSLWGHLGGLAAGVAMVGFLVSRAAWPGTVTVLAVALGLVARAAVWG